MIEAGECRPKLCVDVMARLDAEAGRTVRRLTEISGIRGSSVGELRTFVNRMQSLISELDGGQVER